MLVYVICIIAPFFWQSLVSLVANNNKTKNKNNKPTFGKILGENIYTQLLPWS